MYPSGILCHEWVEDGHETDGPSALCLRVSVGRMSVKVMRIVVWRELGMPMLIGRYGGVATG